MFLALSRQWLSARQDIRLFVRRCARSLGTIKAGVRGDSRYGLRRRRRLGCNRAVGNARLYRRRLYWTAGGRCISHLTGRNNGDRSNGDGYDGGALQKERWSGTIDTVGSTTLVNALAQTVYGGAVAACGLAGGSDFPARCCRTFFAVLHCWE